MTNCAFIFIASLPTVWTIVGCLLIVITLIAIVLFFVKTREVAALKKEVMELRDTMRMMRYEEISLSRMLHTADKAAAPEDEAGLLAEDIALPAPPIVEEDSTEQPTEEPAEEPAEEVAEQSAEEIAELIGEEPVDEPIQESSEPAIEEEVTEEPSEEELEEIVEESEEPTEEPSEEELEEIVESPEESVENTTEIEEIAVEPTAEDIVENEIASPVEEEKIASELTEEVQSEEPVIVTTGKQPINERRPAIPTDLFSAWFEEYEQTEPEVSTPATAEETPSTPAVTVVEEFLPAEAPTEELEKSMENTEASAEDNEEQASVPTTMSKEDERFCRKFERIVDTRMRNPNLNIDVIAAQFGIGRTNFYRKVRELMGMSPNDYLRKCRMDRAAELLRTTDLPVSDVCVQIGVPDAQYFSRVFKTFYGVTPTAYREQA